jgi:bifunctional oligoribonuclease and PAP phosphatase NrnA
MIQSAKALKILCSSTKRILLSGPIGPDGDSIGACLAFQELLLTMGCKTVHVAAELSFRYSWLPHAEGCLSNDEIQSNYDVVIILDGDQHRLTPQVKSAFGAAKTKCIIDHHSSSKSTEYDVAIIDPYATATCSIIYDIMTLWDCPLTTSIATNIYVGLIFDTGGFRYANTTVETHRLAAELLQKNIDHAYISAMILTEKRPQGIQLLGQVLTTVQYFGKDQIAFSTITQSTMNQLGCVLDDLEGIVETILYISGVELSCLCIEKPSSIKVSLRSRSKVNVASLAKKLSTHGGGHMRAAGATINKSLMTGLPYIQSKLLDAIAE